MSSSHYENKKLKRKDVKKVYIRKRKKYVALSFDEFNRRKENTYLYTKKKFIVVQGNLLEVTDKVYVDYYAEKEHSLYLKRMTKGSIAFSLDALENKEIIIESALITDELAEEIEKKMTLEKLREVLETLSAKEKEVIEFLYFKNYNEQEMAEFFGVSQQAISKRKSKVLKKLKKFLEK